VLDVPRISVAGCVEGAVPPKRISARKEVEGVEGNRKVFNRCVGSREVERAVAPLHQRRLKALEIVILDDEFRAPIVSETRRDRSLLIHADQIQSMLRNTWEQLLPGQLCLEARRELGPRMNVGVIGLK